MSQSRHPSSELFKYKNYVVSAIIIIYYYYKKIFNHKKKSTMKTQTISLLLYGRSSPYNNC